MASKVRNYFTPVVTSFSESEIMDLLGPARTDGSGGTPDLITTSDPSSGGGSGKGPADPKKARK